MDLSQFSPNSENETILREIVKLLHKVDKILMQKHKKQ